MAVATARKVALPLAGLDQGRRDQIINGLNDSLAELIDLALSSKQAHWNVVGPNFKGLHELFDEIAEGVRGYSDEIAERVRAVGGVSRGTVDDVRGSSTLRAFPAEETEWQALTEEMHFRLLAVSEDLRKRAGDVEDDLVTQDLYIEVMTSLDKWAWMVQAHLG